MQHRVIEPIGEIRSRRSSLQRILFLTLPGVEILDLAGSAQVFETANGFGANYELSYFGPNASVTSAQLLSIQVTADLPSVAAGDLVLVPGVRGISQVKRFDPQIIHWIRNAHEAGVRFASVCSGAFVLGHAGLLDNRRCTTHWSLTTLLQRSFPKARIQESALFVQDGLVTTSAGIAAGIDMALAIVERDHGPRLTAKVARELVIYMRRDGSQSQVSVYLEYRTHLHQGVHRVQDWLASHFNKAVSLDRLGKLAGLSGRHLARQFKIATGLTPLEYQQQLRIELAASLMKNPELTLEVVAERCGFEDARSLRRLWRGVYGEPPSRNRARKIFSRRTDESAKARPSAARN